MEIGEKNKEDEEEGEKENSAGDSIQFDDQIMLPCLQIVSIQLIFTYTKIL